MIPDEVSACAYNAAARFSLVRHVWLLVVKGYVVGDFGLWLSGHNSFR